MNLKPKVERVLGGRQDLLSTAFTFTVDGKPSKDSFLRFMDGVKPFVYRSKGYVSLEDGEYYMDGVMEEIILTPVKRAREKGIVLLYKTANPVKKMLPGLAAECGIDIKIK
jgi:hypothetical protein